MRPYVIRIRCIESLWLRKKRGDSCPNRPQYPNSFAGNAKDLPQLTELSSRDLAPRIDCGFGPRQVYSHWRMIRDPVRNCFVQFAHRNRKMRSEPEALLGVAWIVDERLDEYPVKLELAYEATIVASERAADAFRIGGQCRTRTCDLLLVRQAL
jgi:hypothetical protein